MTQYSRNLEKVGQIDPDSNKQDGSKEAEREIIEQVFTRKPRNYVITENLNIVLHASLVKEVKAARKRGLYFVLEDRSETVQLYGPGPQLLEQFSITKKKHFDQKFHILQIAFDSKSQVLGFVATDKNLYFYSTIDTNSLLCVEDLFSSPATGIWFLPTKDRWLTSDVDNYLIVWRLNRKAPIHLEVSSFKSE